jgi:uncharacterized membrane protein
VRDNKFLQRLKQEIPDWVELGWVQPDHQRAILDHVAKHASGGTRYLTMAFALMGVLLLGTGVITFFAANWRELSKLAKLIILFGAMWLAYGGSHYFRGHAPKLAEALVLLGVILFGANIHLIAQIYHIDAHYPNGVLMWAVGALLAAYLLDSQPAMVAALLLGLLWSGMENWNFDQRIHWPFFVLWGACALWIFKQHWRVAWHAALAVLIFWCANTFFGGFGHSNQALHAAQFFFLSFVALFVVGLLFATFDRLRGFAGITERYAAAGALLTFFSLTFPDVHTTRSWRSAEEVSAIQTAVPAAWLIATIVAAVVLLALAFWHRTRSTTRPRFFDWGVGVIVLAIALILFNLIGKAQFGGNIALLFNLLFFAGLVWLVYAGIHLNDRFLVNLAFVFFAFVVLARYFDTFWTLMDRSFFFMAGGLLLMVGGYALERGRRKVTGQIGGGQGS